MKKYSIENTTKEERAERSAQAEAINSLGAKKVAPEDQELFQRHIDGELEIEEVTQMLIYKYKKAPEWAEILLDDVFEKEDFIRIGRELDFIFQTLAFMGKASYHMSLANTVVDNEKRVPKDLKKRMKLISQQIRDLQNELREI